MSFWDSIFDSEYRQRSDINALKRSSDARRRAQRRVRYEVSEQQDRIEELEHRVGELTLICRSLMTVLRENEAVSPERLSAVMTQIDAEDGVIDGKVTPEPKPKENTVPEIRPWPKGDRIR